MENKSRRSFFGKMAAGAVAAVIGNKFGGQSQIQDPQRELELASKKGDVTQMRRCLQLGASANRLLPDPSVPMAHFSPLYYAARSGTEDAVRVLLDAGALVDLGLVLDCSHTPLCVASSVGVASLLIERGANPNFNDDLMHVLAYQANDPSVVRLLLDSGSLINGTKSNPEFEETPLGQMIAYGALVETIEIMVKQGADLGEGFFSCRAIDAVHEEREFAERVGNEEDIHWTHEVERIIVEERLRRTRQSFLAGVRRVPVTMT